MTFGFGGVDVSTDQFEAAYMWYESIVDGQKWYPEEVSEFVVSSPAQSNLLPWWLRNDLSGSGMSSLADERSLFTDAYPVLYPYYPFAVANPEWLADPWAIEPYHGYWWG